MQPSIFTTTRHQYTLQDGEEVEICIQSFEPRELLASPPLTTPDPSSRPPWILAVNGTVFIEPGRDDMLRPTAGKFGGLLIKRELIPQAEDEFLRHMMSVNCFTRQQAQQLFDAQGRLLPKFRGRGVSGTDRDDSWIFELGMVEIAPGYRREGVGRKLVECAREEVLGWARDAQRDVLMILMLGTPKSEVDEYLFNKPAASAVELQNVSSAARLTAKRFWRSLGYRRLSARSNWFGWVRPVAGSGPRDQPSPTGSGEWETEDEMIKIDCHDDETAPDVAEKLTRYNHYDNTFQ